MNIIDIIIVLLLLSYGIIGFKRGVFKQTVVFVGTILVLIIAYKLKNIVGDFLVLNLPFWNFGLFLKSATALNIIFYQTIAFILMFCVLMIVFKMIVTITGIFEKLLRITIILGIPSKILGFIVGLIEGYIIVYVILFIICQPSFRFDLIQDSKYAYTILDKTPVVSKITENALQLAYDIYDLKDIDDTNELNLRIIDLALDKEVTTVDIIQKLVDKKKLEVNNINSVLNKYK